LNKSEIRCTFKVDNYESDLLRELINLNKRQAKVKVKASPCKLDQPAFIVTIKVFKYFRLILLQFSKNNFSQGY